jgi:hypothetical protein
MKDRFLFNPAQPVILKKTDANNQSKERLFLFYSTEEKENYGSETYHKFTIYFCPIVPDIKNKEPVVEPRVDLRGPIYTPLDNYNHYSILIKNQKEASIEPWNITSKYSKYPEKNSPAIFESKSLDFQISPQSYGIGSLILNHLIYWGKQLYPDAKIGALKRSFVDERDKNNLKRRDKLYNNIGLIKYKGKKSLSQLTPELDRKNFQVINLHEYLNEELFNSESLKKEIECKPRQIKALIDDKNDLFGKVSYKKTKNICVFATFLVFSIVLYFYIYYF